MAKNNMLMDLTHFRLDNVPRYSDAKQMFALMNFLTINIPEFKFSNLDTIGSQDNIARRADIVYHWTELREQYCIYPFFEIETYLQPLSSWPIVYVRMLRAWFEESQTLSKSELSRAVQDEYETELHVAINQEKVALNSKNSIEIAAKQAVRERLEFIGPEWWAQEKNLTI